jgi:FixJ family two-component response regulator
MGGLELYQLLLAQGFKIPVIFITAHEDPEADVRAASAGAAGFLYKPFHNDKLWETVLHALSASGAK